MAKALRLKPVHCRWRLWRRPQEGRLTPTARQEASPSPCEVSARSLATALAGVTPAALPLPPRPTSASSGSSLGLDATLAAAAATPAGLRALAGTACSLETTRSDPVRRAWKKGLGSLWRLTFHASNGSPKGKSKGPAALALTLARAHLLRRLGLRHRGPHRRLGRRRPTWCEHDGGHPRRGDPLLSSSSTTYSSDHHLLLPCSESSRYSLFII